MFSVVIAYSFYFTQNPQKSQNYLSCSCILRWRWNPRNCRLGLKTCDGLRGVSANGFMFTLRQPS